jgi:hypothetical protein
MTFDWRAEFRRQHGHEPGGTAEPPVQKRTAAPEVERAKGFEPHHQNADIPALAAAVEPTSGTAAGNASSYRRDTDGALMVEVAPHRFVNAAFLAAQERAS